MGKAVTGILLIAAAVAVNVIPGVGQFVSGTILSAVGTSFAAISAVYTAVGIGLTAITALGLQSLARVLGLGPKIPKPASAEGTLKSPTPPRVRGYGERRLYGANALYDVSGEGTTVDVLAIFDGRTNALVQWYLNDDRVTLDGSRFVNALADSRYNYQTIRLDYRLGLPTETAFGDIVANVPGIWTSGHRGDGVTSMSMTKRPVSSKRFLEVYPQGDNTIVSAAFQLAPVFDPRDGGQAWNNPATWTYSENALLHYLHFEMTEGGYNYVTEILPVISTWNTAANICDEAIPLDGGGTEPRYRGCVIYQSTDEIKAVRAELLSTFDGWSARRSDGALMVFAGKIYVPTITLGPDEVIEATVQSFVESEGQVNELIVTSVSKDHDYAQPECEAWRDEVSITEIGLKSQPFGPQTPSYSQNRRLAKRSMAMVNSDTRGTIRTNAYGRVAQGHRYINLNLTENGIIFFVGVVEIEAAERFFEDAGGMTFQWTAIPFNFDTWNPATEQGDPASLGERVPLSNLPAPVITSAAPDYSDIGESGGIGGGSVTGVRIIINGTGPDREDLTWFARWRVGAGPYSEREYPDEAAGPSVTLTTEYVPYGASVDVEISYRAGDGRNSDWSDAETVAT